MPKYYEFKVAGYYLYFTSFCVVECMHVHASDKKLQAFIKENYEKMYEKWAQYSENGFYRG